MDAFPHSEYREFPRALAEQVREEFPHLWSKHGTGGNPPTAFTGDHAYMLWGLWLAGDRSPEVVDWATRRREAYASRHRNDFRKGGVIAAIKWGVILPIGLPAMMDELEQARPREERKNAERSQLELRILRASQRMHSAQMEYNWLTEGWPGRMVRNPTQAQIDEQHAAMQWSNFEWTQAISAGREAGVTYDRLDELFEEGKRAARGLFRLVHGDR